MVELLKVLAEILAKAISPKAIHEARRERRLTELGTTLFLLYSDLNSIIVLGRSIIQDLDSALSWMKRKVKEGEPKQVYWHSIVEKLRQQSVKLENFLITFSDLQLELELLDPDLPKNIHSVIGLKVGIITILEKVIFVSKSSARLIEFNEEKFKDLLVGSNSLDRFAMEEYLRNDQMTSDLVMDSGIPDIEDLRAERYPLIEAYLKSNRPQERIDALEDLARTLRSCIEANFSVQDILLEVGDRRSLPRRNR